MLSRRMPSPAPSADIDALIVRTAVDDLVAHLAHESFGDVALPRCTDDSGDSAHGLLLSFHTHGRRIPLCGGHWRACNLLKTIVAILSRIAFPAIAGGENDIGHFASGHEVERFLAFRCPADQLRSGISETTRQ